MKSFAIWNKKDENGNPTSVLEWKTTMGPAKKKLLARLPQYFPRFLEKSQAQKSATLWNDFNSLMKVFNNAKPTKAEVNGFGKKAKDWVKLFLDYGFRLTTTKDVTPYMHVLAIHVPEMLQRYGNIKFCTAEGVEANNFDCNRIYSRQSNRSHPAKDILRNENRRRDLEEKNKVRKKREYVKRNKQFWEEEKKGIKIQKLS
eukprot:Lithocolla_globosa_v1_NODE_6737_length_1042_cov_34.523810.p1 type:complete len:201 gc:universal NODE_6737_length_1042_cov_34.523810:731-129(-)